MTGPRHLPSGRNPVRSNRLLCIFCFWVHMASSRSQDMSMEISSRVKWRFSAGACGRAQREGQVSEGHDAGQPAAAKNLGPAHPGIFRIRRWCKSRSILITFLTCLSRVTCLQPAPKPYVYQGIAVRLLSPFAIILGIPSSSLLYPMSFFSIVYSLILVAHIWK